LIIFIFENDLSYVTCGTGIVKSHVYQDAFQEIVIQPQEERVIRVLTVNNQLKTGQKPLQLRKQRDYRFSVKLFKKFSGGLKQFSGGGGAQPLSATPWRRHYLRSHSRIN
jgi:ABC-type branched-subunit amino acid transport system ATPase component